MSLSDEHGVLNVPDADSYKIGDQLQVIPNHICPCVNLYDYAYATSDGLITDIWHVSARGQSQ